MSLMFSPQKYAFYVRQTGRIEQRQSIELRINAPDQSGQHLAGPTFHNRSDTARLDCLHTLNPAHRPKGLPVERITNAARDRLQRDIDVVDQSNLWRQQR